MPIQVNCSCGKSYRLADNLAGKRFKCKSCSKVLTIQNQTAEDEDEFGFMDVDLDAEFTNAPSLPPAPKRQATLKHKKKAPAKRREPSNWTAGRVMKKFFGVLAMLFVAIMVLGMIVTIVRGDAKPGTIARGGVLTAVVGSVGFKWLFLD